MHNKGNETDILNEANSCSIEATDLETFNNLVNEKNIQKMGASLNDKTTLIPGLEASRDLARWAKEAAEGDVSEAYDVDDAFVVAYIESVFEKGVSPLDRVRNRVEYLARQEKKAEIIENDFQGKTSLEEIASEFGLSVETANNITFSSPAIAGVGLEPDVVAKAMTLEAGQVSRPIRGENGVFVIAIDSKNMQAQENIAQIREINQRGMVVRVDNGGLFDALKEEADIVDNRSKFY